MKRKLLLILLSAFAFLGQAQNAGDTIRVQAFNYNSTTRDTMIQFPNNPALTFEKIILKYNMRCKNATVLTGADDGVTGCGEWDYSCNTFVADNDKIEKVLTQWPDYEISNFIGTSFPYTTQPTFDHYDFIQQQVTLNSINSETATVLGNGSAIISDLFRTSLKSGRSQILLTAAQLQAAGFSAGALNGIGLNVSNSGGLLKFLKIRIKTATIAALPAQSVTFDGFTDVFF